MTEDSEVLAALSAGDESAFRALVDTHSSGLLRVAMVYVGNRSVAEEVVQETWLGVVRGLDRFQFRSSLKTWIYKILTNTAITRASRERRSVPFSALSGGGEGTSVDPDRSFDPENASSPGHWALGSTPRETPEQGLLSAETRQVIFSAMQRLPTAQRTVIALRDVEGWPSTEVCRVLALSEGNQRVLLHRARGKVRTALEQYDAAELEAA